ncbi:transcriptional regulator [Aeromicrobium sp. Sec7.5]|uniref:transcriptional regulator n=1 Tax=Aeromicrobium sp. Sec7.5 TaxID=3121276 RepID=UPI002FE43427
MTQAGPAPAFDEVIHAPLRLRVCAFLDAVSSAEFSALRDVLEVADSVVSKHLKVLTEAGYVKLEKPTGRGRVRTWVRLTEEGRRAYRGHVAALRSITAPTSPD